MSSTGPSLSMITQFQSLLFSRVCTNLERIFGLGDLNSSVKLGLGAQNINTKKLQVMLIFYEYVLLHPVPRLLLFIRETKIQLWNQTNITVTSQTQWPSPCQLPTSTKTRWTTLDDFELLSDGMLVWHHRWRECCQWLVSVSHTYVSPYKQNLLLVRSNECLVCKSK